MVDYKDYININTDQILAGNGDAGDSWTSATPIALDADKAKCVIEGFSGHNDRWDYYSFVAPESGRVAIRLTGLDGNLYTRFFNSDGDEQGGAKPNNSLDKISSYVIEAGETYYVAVDPYLDAESRYDLVIDAISAAETLPASPPDDYSDYVNGDIVTGGDASGFEDLGTSAPLDSYGRVTIDGTVGYNDDEVDRYTFTVTESGQLEVDLTGLTGNIFTRLYNGGSAELVSTIANNADDKHLVYNVVAGNVYTVVVDPYYNAESPYTLTIDAPPDGGTVIIGHSDYIAGHKVSGGDVADSQSGAAVVPLTNNHTGIIAAVGFDGDTRDWYQFDVPQDSEMVTISWSGLSDDLSVTLTESNNAEVWSAATDQVSTKTETLTPGETYYLVVDAGGVAVSDYHLNIDAAAEVVALNPDSINGEFIGDAGGDLAHAAPAELNSAGVITISGSVVFVFGGSTDAQDWYSFVMPLDGEIEINLSDTVSFRTELHDSDGIVADSDNLNANETYFIGVSPNPFSGTGESNYDLTLTLAANAVDTLNGDPVPGDDAGDSATAAVPVYLDVNDVRIEGVVGSEDVADYYHVAMPATQGSLTLDLSDFAGKLSVAGAAGLVELDHESIPINFTGGEVFDLVVEAAGEDILKYDFLLDIEVEDDPLPGTDRVNNGVVDGGDAGNSTTNAAPVLLNPNATIAGTVGNGDDVNDYYQVTLPDSAGNLILDLTDFTAKLAVDLNGQLLELPNQRYDYNLDGGTYNLVVTSPTANASDYDFSLIVNAFASGADVVGGNLVAAGDAGDIFSSASEAPIALSESAQVEVSGSVGFDADEGDFYQFTAAASGLVNVALGEAEETLNAILFDSDGHRLACHEIGAAVEVSFPVVGDENYIIVIEPFSGSEAAYHLAFGMA